MLTFDQFRRPERQLLITGPAHGVCEADKMVRKAVRDKSNIDIYEMGIDMETVEKFIGKEVDIIRDIQGHTGTSIMIRSEMDSLTGPMARIIIAGTGKEISKALPYVEDKLKFYDESKAIKRFGEPEKKILTPELKLLDLLVIGPEIHVHVTVITIKSPNKFFVQVDSLQNIETEQLKTELNTFYNTPHNLKMLGMHDIYPGHVVAVKHENGNWERCEILEVHEDSCDILFIDIGNEGTAKKSEIYELPQHFLSYIVQAYECTLNNIGELDGGWDKKAIARFKELCVATPPQKVCMHVKNTKIDINPRGFSRRHIYMVDLYNGDLNIGTQLRKEKLAIKENSMTKYFRRIPKIEEARVREKLESFKMYQEMNEDLDEELREQMELEDLESDDDFSKGEHDTLDNVLNLLKDNVATTSKNTHDDDHFD
ncbi:PREDICTED: tudor and KH domain-containing protein [Polistes dominula]|uniref:Tudor and KH domain-containing protein n=1 Tax=Polistes dominula TaxID=743375 RepID=A0ABM1I559_POLDO|nr:PREDICTED: tudor and KH domain-containing protein [Polistes dominula]